jgi:hypothetical protein
MMCFLGMDGVHALSPQAKGNVEPSFHCLQDCTCIYENPSSLEDVRGVLKTEANRYKDHQVHSTTGEIPKTRFQKAK